MNNLVYVTIFSLCLVFAIGIFQIMESLQLEVQSLRLELDVIRKERDLYRSQRNELLDHLRMRGQDDTAVKPSVPMEDLPEQAKNPCSPSPVAHGLGDNVPQDTVDSKTDRVQCDPSTVVCVPRSGTGANSKPSCVVRSVAVLPSPNTHEDRIYRTLKDQGRDKGLDGQVLVRFHMDTRPVKVFRMNWLDIQLPPNSQLLIISDSIFRWVDPAFHQTMKADLFVFGGMAVYDLLVILFHAAVTGVKADHLVLCVGTNDILGNPSYHGYVKADLKNALNLAQKISSKVTVCTVYEVGWRVRRPRRRRNTSSCQGQVNPFASQYRLDFNAKLCQLAEARNMSVLDLSAIFSDRKGKNKASPSWYMADSVHPTVNGTIAIEVCLSQLLSNHAVVPPALDDPRLHHNSSQVVLDAEIDRRKAISLTNRHCSGSVLSGKMASKRLRVSVRNSHNSSDEDGDTWDNKRRRNNVTL